MICMCRFPQNSSGRHIVVIRHGTRLSSFPNSYGQSNTIQFLPTLASNSIISGGHTQNLKILLLLFKNFLAGGDEPDDSSSRVLRSWVSFLLLFSFSWDLAAAGTRSVGRNTVLCDAVEVLLLSTRLPTRLLVSARGRLIRCEDSRRVRFGFPGKLFSLPRSVPAARLASRRRRLEGLVSGSSKSFGRNAAGALWKSTTAGAGRRSARACPRRFPCDILWILLLLESSDRVLLTLEKLGERREKLLAMLAMLSFLITELAEARN
jgi:hypothetical protein